VPVEVERLRQIDWLPISAAVLLGVSALLAVGHALVTGVRRRRRELAILKTLGFDRRQVRSTIAWQATTLGLTGLVLGVPTGVLLAEIVWRLVATDIGVSTATTLPAFAIILTIPCVLLFVNLVAFLPARAAAGTRVALSLRDEPR
jgi:putative ABC transport system permease protein